VTASRSVKNACFGRCPLTMFLIMGNDYNFQFNCQSCLEYRKTSFDENYFIDIIFFSQAVIDKRNQLPENVIAADSVESFNWINT